MSGPDWHAIRELLIVRHGQTAWNVAGRRQGQLDSPLTAEGLAQADALADELAATGASAVFTSPLGRSLATAEPIAAALGREPRLVPGLREIDHGRFAGLSDAEIDQRWPGVLAERRRQKYDWAFPGGESYRSARGRVRAALASIAATAVGSAVIVTHEMVGRLVLAELLSLTVAETLDQRLPHGLIVRVDPVGQRLLSES